MSWELGVTELGSDECELVELGLVLPPDSLSVGDERRSRSGKTASESFVASDLLKRLGSFKRAFADAAAVSESGLQWRGAFKRSVDDLMAVFELDLRSKGAFRRSLADSTGASDALFRAFAAWRVLSESQGISDSRKVSARAVLREIGAASDALARLFESRITLTDSQPLALARRVQVKAVRVDIGAVSDAISRSLAARRSVADQATVSEAVSRSVQAYRAVQDSQGTDDSRRARVNAVFRDVEAASDTFSRLFAVRRVFEESQALGLVRRLRPHIGFSEIGAVSDAVGRFFGARRAFSESAIIADDRQARVSSLWFESVIPVDLAEWVAGYRRQVAESQAVGDAGRRKPRAVMIDDQAAQDELRRLVQTWRRDDAAVVDEVRRVWAALRAWAEIQESTDERRSHVRSVKADNQAVAEDLRRAWGAFLAVAEALQLAESRRVRAGIVRSDEQVLAASLHRAWSAFRSVTDSQELTEDRRARPGIVRSDEQAVVDSGNWFRVLWRRVEQLGLEDSRRLALSVLRVDAQGLDELRTMKAGVPVVDSLATGDVVLKRPIMATFDHVLAHDAIRRSARLLKVEASELIERYDRTWRAFRTVGESSVLDEWVGWLFRVSPFSEILGMGDIVAKRPQPSLRDGQRVRDSFSRLFEAVRSFVDDAAPVDLFRRGWRASRFLADDVPSAGDAISKAARSVKRETQAVAGAMRSTWSAVREVRESARIRDAGIWRSMRMYLLGEAVSTVDATKKSTAVFWSDSLVASDSPIWRRVRAAFRDLVGALDSVFRWDPTQIRLYGFRAWFVLAARTLGFTRSARTLPFEFSTRWVGQRVLRMMSGEARVVRVLVEAAEGDAFVISAASVEVFDERTNEVVDSGLAEIDGDRLSYLFRPPAPGVYTLVFTVHVGPQVIKHKETVRVVA